MIIRLDGTTINSPIDGVKSIVVNHRIQDEDGQKSKSFSEELTFYGVGFDMIKERFIDDPGGKFNLMKIEILEDCCGDSPFVVFEGIIRGDTVGWCEGDCFAKVQSIEDTSDTRKNDCLDSTLVYDNRNGFQENILHPRMVYCVELRPSILQDFTLIVGILMNLMFFLLFPIVLVLSLIISIINAIISVINAIIDAINTLPGIDIDNIDEIDLDGDSDTNTLEEYQNFIDRLNENIIGCGRFHPSPYVRSYIDNVCEICELTWESSILKNPQSQYHNTVYLSAPIEKGTRDDDVNFILENAPIKSGTGFMNDLKIIFNGDYRIKNGHLRFERKDAFYDNDIWLSYDELKNQNRIVDKICYSWRDDDVPSYLRLEYTPDPVDWAGNEAKKYYSEIVEWNQPYNPRQKGSKEILFPFSAARFRTDGIDRDVLGDYSWFPGWSNLIDDFDQALILPMGVSFNPKLIIANAPQIGNNTANTFNVPGYDKPPDENFNYPFHLSEFNTEPITAYDTDEFLHSLYARFFSIDHPKLLQDQGKEFEFTFKFNCDHLLAFEVDKNIQVPLGEGRITSVRVDYIDRIMTVLGEI